MTKNVQIKLCCKSALLKRLPYKKSTLHTRIQEGLMVPSISLGGTLCAWPEHEIDIILRAMCAGKPPEEIKQLVADLVAKRSELVEGEML